MSEVTTTNVESGSAGAPHSNLLPESGQVSTPALRAILFKVQCSAREKQDELHIVQAQIVILARQDATLQEEIAQLQGDVSELEANLAARLQPAQ